MSLSIAASDISQEQNWFGYLKRCNIALCLCISLYHKDKTGAVYSKRYSIAFRICTLSTNAKAKGPMYMYACLLDRKRKTLLRYFMTIYV